LLGIKIKCNHPEIPESSKKRKSTVVKLPTPLEAKEQEALIRWSQYHKLGEYLFAIPNGGLRDKRTARRLKLQGVKPGVSDLFFAYPCNGKHGLFIEIKRQGTGKLTKEQKEFMDRCLSVGYEAKVAYGWKEAVYILQTYLVGSRNGVLDCVFKKN
jgi:VRR-NUC domain